MHEAWTPVLIAAVKTWDGEIYAQGLTAGRLGAGRAGAKPCLPQPSCTSPAGTQARGDPYQLPADTPGLQERSHAYTDALLLPVHPWLKMGHVNQHVEPRTPKPALQRCVG